MRVFLDTNVIVAAVATRGLCADVVRDVLARHDLIVSDDLLGEIERVLRTKLGVPAEAAAEVVALIGESGTLVRASRAIEVPIPDSMDRILVTAALEAGAELFVTGDRKLLEIARLEALEFVSPRAFWDRIRGA